MDTNRVRPRDSFQSSRKRKKRPSALPHQEDIIRGANRANTHPEESGQRRQEETWAVIFLDSEQEPAPKKHDDQIQGDWVIVDRHDGDDL